MRRLSTTLVLATSLALGACRTTEVKTSPTSTTTTPQPTASTQPIPAGSTTLPAGTPLHVQLQDELSTQASKVGQQVHASVVTPIKDAEGKTVLPAGAEITGTVTELHPSSRVDKPASIRVNFDKLATQGKTETIQSEVVEAKPETSQNYGRAGKGAAIGAAGGAVVGAIIGRSVTGAVVGGLAGAGVGTAISLGTGDVNAKLPAGTAMTLQLTQPVRVG